MARDGKYFKLWRRFYEPLILLKILGSTRGQHSPSLEPTPLHRFLDNLAYLCDHQKGGNTTSAVAIEDTPERFVFWIASNCPSQCEKSVPFLTYTLVSVRSIADAPSSQQASLTEELVRRCVEFAQARVKKEASMLKKDMSKCMVFVKELDDPGLIQWLLSFRGKEGYKLCSHAHQERDSAEMRRFNDLLSEHDLPVYSEQSIAIRAVTHEIGRLAHHIRAPHQVVEDVLRRNDHLLRNVLDEFVVRAIGPQPVVCRPDVDPNITMHAIMKRMLPKGEMLKPQYRDAASVMNDKYGIVDGFKKQYGDKNFKPLIHAEVQVLEHFWASDKNNRNEKNQGRQFLDDDRFIGCSKPACYCCHLYFESHPARCVVPQTSKKVYPNWGLKALSNGPQDDDYYIHQRDILNKMVQRIRDDALDQILRKAAAPAPWHPDSLTGFTWNANANMPPVVYGGESFGIRGGGDIMPRPVTILVERLEHVAMDESYDDDSESGGGARL